MADAVATAALVLLPFVALGRALGPGRVLAPADNLLQVYPWKAVASVAPANPLLADVTYQYHPWLLYAAREMVDGRVPLWNPHIFAGAPFFAVMPNGLLFPPAALAYILPAPLALTVITLVKFSIAGVSMYWFLRVLAIGPLGATVGAVAYMFSAPFVVWAQTAYASAIAVFPLLLGAAERLRQRQDGRAIAVLAAVVAIEILAGYPQGALYGLIVATAWAVCRAGGAAGGIARFFGRFAVAVMVGLGLAAVQVLPFLEYAGESVVIAYRSAWVPFLYLPARSVITLLLPYYYGSPTGGDFWGDWNFAVQAVSVGIVPCLLLPTAIALAWRAVGTRFFLGLGALAAAMAYGFPGVASTLASLPLLGMGSNLRATPLIALSLSALGAIGIEALSRARSGAGRRPRVLVRVGFLAPVGLAFVFLVGDRDALVGRTTVPIAVQYAWFFGLMSLGAVAALGWLRAAGTGRAWAMGLLLVELASLLPLAVTYNPVTDARMLYPETPVVQYLRRETAADHSRILLEALNVGMLYGLSAPTGYDAMTPARFQAVVGPIGTGRTIGLLGTEPLTAATLFSSPVVDLLGVRHFVVPPGAPSPGPGLTLEYDQPDARVYRSERALPRAFLVSSARCVDAATAIALIRQRVIDFRATVLLEGGCAAAPSVSRGRGRSSVEIRQYQAGRAMVAVESDSPAYLVLTDTWFPGWRARVDGTESTVWQADHAFRAVWVAPGRHIVEFRYEPATFKLGLGLSGLGACAVVGLYLAGVRSARRSEKHR